MSSLVAFFFLFFSFSAHLEVFKCPTLETFKNGFLPLFSEEIQQEVGEKKRLLYDVLKEKGTVLGEGTYGQVLGIKGSKENLAMKIVDFSSSRDEELIQEVRNLKIACGQNPDAVLAEPFNCDNAPIAPFRACLVDSVSLYVLQRRSYKEIKDREFLDFYQHKPVVERIIIMLNIIDKFVELHQKNIIHSDIKPANIMVKDQSLADFEIIDLGLAGTVGDKHVGGTPRYLAPEGFRSSTKFTPQIDIYSLALTLMELELNFFDLLKNVGENCFKNGMTRKCHEEMMKYVVKVFNNDRKNENLKPIFDKALSFSMEERQVSMERFSMEIVDQLKKYPNANDYLKNLKIEPKLFYTWKNYAINGKQNPNSNSAGLWNKMLSLVGWGSAPEANAISNSSRQNFGSNLNANNKKKRVLSDATARSKIIL